MPRKPKAPQAGAAEVVDVLAEDFDQDKEFAAAAAAGTIDLRPEPEQPVYAPVVATSSANAPLTPEQQRIRDLEHRLAQELGRKDPEPDFEPPAATGENILIHFCGQRPVTALGQLWYAGQELEFSPGSAAYRDTFDRFGRTWLDLRHDEQAQIRKWGEVRFRPGPWPGLPLSEGLRGARWEQVKPLKPGERTEPSEEEVRRAELKEAQRRRAAPRLPMAG